MSPSTSVDGPVAAEVWTWPLDVSAQERQALFAHLSPEERLRAGRYHWPLDGERWITARGRMREILGRAVGRPPAALRFRKLEHGRPELLPGEGPAPSFNLSHSGGLAALAVSFDAVVGVDVEAHRLMAEEDIAYALSPAERRQLSGLGVLEREAAFFRFWTLKEAFIKALGTGLSLPLHDFDMRLADDGGEPLLARLAGAADEPARWRFRLFDAGPGFGAALAVRTEGRHLKVVWHGPCTSRECAA